MTVSVVFQKFFGSQAVAHILLAVLFFVAWQHFNTEAKCLTEKPGNSPRRNFYYNSTSLPIIIETSDRSSHQLISRILRILLTEVLNYTKVDLKEGYNSMNIYEILDRLSGNGKIPETMINLEVWLNHGFNIDYWVDHGNIVNGGPLGPSGRFGWFQPTSFVEQMWNRSNIATDHWKALRLTEVTSQFALTDQIDLLRSYLTRVSPDSNITYCDMTKYICSNGIFYPLPHRCHHSSNKCAILISDFPVEDLNELLLEQIETLELDVAIAWIGDHFNSFIESLQSKNIPVLFFNWMPNDITADNSYSHMLFPTCQAVSDDRASCDFELHQLTKMTSSLIQLRTPEAYHLVTQMLFSKDNLSDLLQSFVFLKANSSDRFKDVLEEEARRQVLEEVACQWVQEHRSEWRRWLPHTLSSKTPIYLGGMFPLSGPYWRSPGILPGAYMAIDYINDDPHILPDHEIVFMVKDSQCLVDVAMPQFLQFVINKTHPVAGIIGPGCSDTVEAVASISKHFNTVVIGYSAEVALIRDRSRFPLFLCTFPHLMQYRNLYTQVFKHFNWERVVLLGEDGTNFPEFHAMLKDYFHTNSIHVQYERKISSKVPIKETEAVIDELKTKETKIIILMSYEQSARVVVCLAYQKGLTAKNGYVWFLPGWFTSEWWGTKNDMMKISCTPDEMKSVIQSHFIFQTPFLGSMESNIVGNLTVAQWYSSYEGVINNLRQVVNSPWESSPYASYAYDAVFVFALGLHRLLSEDATALQSLHKEQTVKNFMTALKGVKFSGASGMIEFSESERSSIVNVMQYIGNGHVQVGQFLLDVPSYSDPLYINESALRWMTPDGKVPSDGRPEPKVCSIESFRILLGVDCDAAIAVANIIGVLLFVITMIVGLIVVKKRYDAKVKRIKDSIGLSQDMSWLGLDKWEIPRDHVVLNRKLGEGAFGTVYGGEALIEDAWLAVAVKTLKIGSNAEEKLDFLSEAEMMKRFDHDNIVKLLGVCTRREPAYAIMEFMLHGDLKTYLLSRRQLVGQSCKEAEDVNAQALTQMAADVAQGLRYLSDLKYVHRDLACRNCLVHAGKAVKIGDFGMTRPLYDSDYYRFNKRGMFPVRWMSPESLTDGIFSASSDIWSYGVLVYEIMTFGSFPYQGLSNRQVLNFVKSGHQITLPSACPLKVQELIRSCWVMNPARRIMIDEIVYILSENTSLIIPCLDDPSRAVALEGTGSIEMSLLPRSRHRSAQKWSSDQPPIRGFSFSSPEKGNSSEDESPDHIMSDPFNLLTPLSNDDAVVVEPNSILKRHSGSHLGVIYGHRKPVDKIVHSSRHSQSLSIDDRASMESETSGVRHDSSLLLHDIIPRAPLCSLEQDDNCNIAETRNSPTRTLPPSLESRTDSDYCSQQFKVFPTIGCLLP